VPLVILIELCSEALNQETMKSSYPYPYCISLSDSKIQLVCDGLDGFGISWITGWKGVDRCVWCKDKVTAVRIVLLTGTLMEVFE
jgi:hypothetical protein